MPYLGTFLTDLMMVDTALKDLTEDGLINFDKCRKEFELMTQIRMLQLSANSYNIEPEPDFFTWFYNLRIYDDTERYQCIVNDYILLMVNFDGTYM